MDAQQFKDEYMQKFFKSEGPETAAILKTMKPGSSGFVYDPQRVDLPRVGADEVVVPITKFGPGASTGKPRRVGSTGMPTYTGGFLQACSLDKQGHLRLGEKWACQTNILIN